MLHLWEGVLLQAWERALYPQVGSQGVKKEAQLIRRQSPCTAARVVALPACFIAGCVAASAWVVAWVAVAASAWVAAWFTDWIAAHAWQNNAGTVLACCTPWGLPDTCGQRRQPSLVRDWGSQVFV